MRKSINPIVLRCLLFALLLFCFVPSVFAKESDLHLEWESEDEDGCSKYNWIAERGCMQFKFMIWSGYKQDDWIASDGDGLMVKYGAKLIFQANGFREGESYTSHSLKFQKIPDLGKLYAEHYDGSKSVWTEITIGKTITWQSNGKTGDDNEGWATLYWYPDASCFGKPNYLRLVARTTDSGNDYFYIRSNSDEIEMNPLSYRFKSVEFAGYNSSNGTYPVIVSEFVNGDKYKHTQATVHLQTSVDKKSWYTHQTKKYVNQRAITETFSDAKYIKYPKGGSDEVGYKNFANGIYFNLKQIFDPDNGSGDYVVEKDTIVKTPSLATLSSRTLDVTHTKDNELVFKWNVYKPTSCDSDHNNWVIERKNGSKWDVVVAGIECKNGENIYEYSLDYSQEKKNETYRVRNTFFASGVWFEYMETYEENIIYYPYYKSFDIIRQNIKSAQHSADISWSMTSDGIWNQDISMRLEYYIYKSTGYDLVKNVQLAYDEDSYTLQNLQSCSKYKVVVVSENKNLNFTDSISTEFYIGDADSHVISKFEATRGYYSDKVRLRWELPKNSVFTSFDVKRITLNDENKATLVAQVGYSSNNTIYTCEDLNVDPGKIYLYSVIGYVNCQDTTTFDYSIGASLDDYGFAQSYASVSGRVCFDGNQGEHGVDVAIVSSNGYNENYSLDFNGHKASLVELPADVIDFSRDKQLTIQAYVNPTQLYNNDTSYLFAHKGVFEIQLVNIGDSAFAVRSANYHAPGKASDTIVAGEWTHLTWSFDLATDSFTSVYYNNGKVKEIKKNAYKFRPGEVNRDSIFYLGANYDREGNFKGYVDEIRVWNTMLDSTIIARDYNRYISGREANLCAYYRCNEKDIDVLFDISGSDELFNKRDGLLGADVEHNDIIVPSASQLANKAITDENGNYIINTIPYNAEGIQYDVIPLLGVHKFNPTNKPIFVSPQSSVFNNVDFTDESSFEVSGTVYYKNTDYPVAGCQLKVDGVTCVLNGKPVVTDANGEFTINVPIGEHYIEVVREGHSFENGGRYPADPNGEGLKFNFNQPISNLIFDDCTTATIVGRVSGGPDEAKKRYGGRLSKNNIGVAEIILEGPEIYSLNSIRDVTGTTTRFEVKSDTTALDNATTEINSKAYIGGGEQSNLITIYTDSVTGEFAIKVPPIQYKVNSIRIPSNDKIHFDLETIDDIDARNVQQPPIDTLNSVVVKDSLQQKNILDYVDDLNVTYRSQPEFKVNQRNCRYGVFGESTYEYVDSVATTTGGVISPDTLEIPLYAIDSISNEVKYLFDYPVFNQGGCYTLAFEGYEEYFNYDNNTRDTVPLKNSLVTITNEFSSEQAVDTATGKLWPELASNQLYLDSLGKREYTFMVGFPNLSAPYTYGLNIVYNVDGFDYQWREKPLEAIVLGYVPGGNQFVTGGPDVVTMILRDPPGSQSYSYFEVGSKTASTFTASPSLTLGGGVSFIRGIGVNYEIETGTFAGAGGGTYVQVLDEEYNASLDKDHNISLGATYGYKFAKIETEIENTRVSTSSGVGYIGSAGDVFIGSATNLLFGDAKEVIIEKDKSNNYTIAVRDVISIGEKFTTTFQYSQSYIEGSLIPNLKKIRNSLLTTVVDTTSVKENNTDKSMYVTNLSPDDPNFGMDGTYKFLPPKGMTVVDTIATINSNIIQWVDNYLKLNEEEKVKAINGQWEDNEYEKFNYSFDSGSSITQVNQVSLDKVHEVGTAVDIPIKFSRKLVINWGGNIKRGANLSITINPKYSSSSSDSKGETTTTGFVLADNDLNNAYTVDVIVPNSTTRSPIFYTRGGQTSCPYADVEKTKYYYKDSISKEPFVISEKTVQIEVPQIRVENPIAINVPVGEAATYKLLLSNHSQTETDLFFDLCVLDETNPHGARIAMDGEAIVGDRPIRIKAGEENTIEKTIRLLQTNQGILEYDSIALVLKSQCQGGLAFSKIIADTVYIHASFIPSCSDVALQIDNQVLNTSVKDAILPIVIKDYNINYTSLRGIRLQYKAERDNNWNLVTEWRLDTTEQIGSKLLNSGEITYNFDMSDNAFFPDGNYQFRAVTICDGDVYNESEVVTVIKDLTRPKLFGSPLPADGILGVSDEISVMFNEDIKASQLTETRNFIVEGCLNGYKVDHSVAMQLFDSGTAFTEANFSVDRTPFAINLWLNYSTPGNILSFGSASSKFAFGVNNAQQLVVSIGDSISYTSTATLPANKWIFLSIGYETIDDDGYSGHLYANYALDASSVELLDVYDMGLYTGRGTITLGGGLTAAMHDLSIWNYARQWEEAQLGMYESKYASSVGLVGYWRMNEGYGSVCQDIARGRHLLLPATNSWHFENENKAVTLDGKNAMALNISNVSPKRTDDYMLELWFRGGTQKETTVLLSNGIGFSVGFDNKGKLQIKTKNSKFLTLNTSNPLLDLQWHHLAINYLYNGVATVYADGEVVGQIAIAEMPDLASDRLFIGAERYAHNDSMKYRNFFIGDVDELRFWKASLTAEYIRHQYRTRMQGSEDGLVAYYPFEKTQLDDFSQQVVKFDYTDRVTDSLSIEFVSNDKLGVALLESEVAPALKEVRQLENVEYSFVASDRQIVINLEEDSDIIEGTTIQFTLRDVEDLNGNRTNPISWTAFVHRNQLKWLYKESQVEMVATTQYNFTAKIFNYGGQVERWKLLNLPSWLSVDVDYGELNPLSSFELSFNVSESLPIGDYEAIIYLVGNNNVYEPFVVKLSVIGQKPDWNVNPSAYEYSMSIIGQLSVDKILSEDENDIVAAFIGDECVGVASPIYNARYDAFYVMLDVFANTINSVIDFKVYDASTGKVYVAVETLSPNSVVVFENNSIIGNMVTPLRWNTLDDLEQRIDLQKGWSWISFYVDVNGKYVKDIISSEASNPIVAFKNKSNTSIIEKGSIKADFALDVSNGYLVKSKDLYDFSIVGDELNPQDVVLSVDSGWSWIGYILSFNSSVTDAFADLVPLTGDVVRSQSNFAIYDGYEWIGTLNVLEPGKGYKYKSSVVRTFTYPSVVVNEQSKFKAKAANRNHYFKPIDNSLFPNNMAVLAKVYDGDILQLNAEVAAFVGQDCRATVFSDEEGYACLTIPGEGQGDIVTFRVKVGEDIYEVEQTIIYQDDAIVGSISEPYRIQIGEDTGIENNMITSATIYTQNGCLYIEGATSDYKVFDAVGRLICIGNSGVISLPRGVYVVQLGSETQKIIL